RAWDSPSGDRRGCAGASFAAVLGHVEHEDAVAALRTLQHLGMAKRAGGIVIARAPVVLHASARELVVLGIALVFLRSIDELDEIPRLGPARRPQQLDLGACRQLLRQLLDE